MEIVKFLLYSVSFLVTVGLFIFLVRRAPRKNQKYWIVGCSIFSVFLLGAISGTIATFIAIMFAHMGDLVLEPLKCMAFQAKVQAELKAQHNDQSFTNLICHRPEHIEYIDFMRTNAYFRSERIAPFMVVCELLGRSIENTELTEGQRHLCARLLAQRLEKVNADKQFRLKHTSVFGELESKLSDWMKHHMQSTG